MKKKTGIIFAVLLTVVMALTLISCSGGSVGENSQGEAVEVDYSRIETVTVDEESISEGFLLSEFNISKVKLNVQYFATYENGNEVEGEIISVPVTDNMVKAEDKAKLRVAGTKTIHIVAFSRFELEFTITLYNDNVTMYRVIFLDEDGTPLQARTDMTGYTQYVAAGGRAIAPTVATKSGYTFAGWRDRDTGRMSAYDNITKDTTFVAVYDKNVFKVSFYKRVGGTDTLISTTNVPREGNALEYAPAIPVVVGYSNGRWENENAMRSITADSSFYAVYDKDQVNVSFVYKRFSETDEANVVKYDVGGQILNPPGAEYPGYKFVEWRVNGRKATFPYDVTSEVVFEAYYVSVANGNESLTYVTNSDVNGVSVSSFGGEEEYVVIPEKTDKLGGVKNVTAIYYGVFKDYPVRGYVVSDDNAYFITEDSVLFNRDKTVLLAYPSAKDGTEYVVPDSVTEIAPYAFYGAEKLTSVTLGNKVASIGDYAFAECNGLTSFTLPATVVTIGDSAFAVTDGESKMQSFSFAAGSVLTSIGADAFYGLSGVTSYALPTGLTAIGSGAFSGNKSLRSVTAEENASFHLYNGALYSADYSTLYVYPALYGESEYPQVEIHSSCTKIYAGAFSYARISGVIVRSRVLIEDEAFDCPTLRYFRLLGVNELAGDEISGRMFADNVPIDIVLPEGATALYSALTAIQAYADSVRYEMASEPSYEPYLSDYYFEEYSYFLPNHSSATGIRILGTRASAETVVLPDTLNGYPVTAIGSRAFAGDLTIKEITLPAALLVIEKEAFLGCKNLESVALGSQVEEIQDAAFADCPGLSGVYVHELNGISAFGVDVFRNTPFINDSDQEFITLGNVLVKYNDLSTSVVVPSTVEYIASDAFEHCGQITSLTFSGEGIKHIDSYAFQFCTGILSVSFPRSIEYVGAYAFDGCDKLTLVTYSVESIDPSLYVDADAYPSGVTQVYSDTTKYTLVYYEESGDVTPPAGVVFITPYEMESSSSVQFAGWYFADDGGNRTDVLAEFPLKLTGNARLVAKTIVKGESSEGLIYSYDEETDSYTVSDYVGTDDYVIVPEKYKNKYVRGIAAHAFERRSSILYIDLPNKKAQDGSTHLEIDNIGVDAFSNTAWYAKFAGDFITIDDYLIKYVGTSETVRIPDGVTRLAEGAFAGNVSVKTVIFPSGMTSVSDNAFNGCTSLEKVVFPSSLLSIGAASFKNCSALKDVNFSVCTGLSIVGYDAFDNTAWLNDYIGNCVMINDILYKYIDSDKINVLHIPNGVVYINDRAFYHNVYLRSVYVPQSTSLIRVSAFEGAAIETVNLFAGGSALSTIQAKAFKDCTNLSVIDLALASDLTFIGEEAFSGCLALQNVVLPTAVAEMGQGVFAGSGLRTVNFASGSKLEKIPDAAFKDCVSLFKVNFTGRSALLTIGDEAFKNCVSLRDFNNSDSAVAVIGDQAFYNCSDMSNFSINTASLREIGDQGLYNVGYVTGQDRDMVVLGNILIKYNSTVKTKVEIPASVTAIYNGAFKDNTYITDVIFPENSAITTINAQAFYGCANLVNINFPDTIVNVGEDAVTGTAWYNNKLRSGEEYIVISNTLIRYNARYIQQAIIPEEVSVINGGAFDGAKVYDILLGENVSLIKEGAFDGVDTTYADWTITIESETPATLVLEDPSSLTAANILLPNELALDGYRLAPVWGDLYARMKVPHRVTVSFSVKSEEGEPVTSIVTNAIYEEIDVVAKEAEDKTYIFVGWYKQYDGSTYSEKVTYPFIMPDDEAVTAMTLYAKFTNDTIGSHGELYTIANGTEIEFYNFETDAHGNITSDNKIVVIGYYGTPDSKLYVVGNGYYVDPNGHYVENAGVYEYVETPGEVTRYSYRGAFEGHTELTEVYFTKDSAIHTIGADAFKDCVNLEKIVLPSSIKRICAGAFAGCTSLREVIIPADASNVVIEENAFSGCTGLREITIPTSVTEIRDGAFSGCTGMMDVYLKSVIAMDIGSTALPFEQNEGMMIHIPHGSYDSYVANWSQYSAFLVEEKEESAE